MDFASNYEIGRTVDFIRSRGYTRVALQFSDELLRDATRVAKALRAELGKGVRLYVMADTAYGSCCIDEVGASHVDAECVVHYGHACYSPTSTLPALFVLGKSPIDVGACAASLLECISASDKPILVLFGLEFAHVLQTIRKEITSRLANMAGSVPVPIFADVPRSYVEPSSVDQAEKEHNSKDFMTGEKCMKCNCNELESSGSYSLGGLKWCIPAGHKMEHYLLFWIGTDNPAFANILLMFNNCQTVRYDASENCLIKDINHHKRVLKRRYYLVERAKDANIVGILVGTLAVAGYLHIVQQMKELIEGAGKKSYTLVMGRPNPAKLANFPECDIFIYVSCAQTALLDSKEFLAPVITPFEAMLAFCRGSQWTGEYVIEFRHLLPSFQVEIQRGKQEEARFSFFKGGYVQDVDSEVTGLKINMEKCELIGINLSDDQRDLVQSIFRTWGTTLAIKYLGLPLSHKGTKSKDWQCVVRKFEGKLQGWKSRMLSSGWRWLLSKTTLQSLPLYYFFILRVPKGICTILEIFRARFFQNGNHDKKGLHLVKWNHVYTPIEEGGVGIAPLEEFNDALLSKWLWKLNLNRDI